MLELPRQVLNLLLFFLQIEALCLQSCAQTGVLILGDVELDLQVTVHVLDLFSFHIAAEHGLVSLLQALIDLASLL